MSMMNKMKEFATECVRVLRITKKPDKEEFMTLVKVAGIGILIIGFIGFVLHMVNQLLVARALG